MYLVYYRSSNNIFALHQDKRKNLWIGTQGGGLNKFAIEDQQNGLFEFTQYNRRHGLPSSSIYAIEEDEDGNLWLSSSHGLTKFDPATEKSLNFDTSHGLQGNEFNFAASFKDTAGNLHFGGTNGLTVFNPNEIKPNSHVPPVVLTKFLKMNLVDSENFSGNKSESIKIHYEDYFVAFEFASLDFAEPSNNQYRYILQGFDENWVDAGKLRRATYTNLPSGNYTFKVKASNNDGVWNEHGIDLAVTVLPPPWKSWWAFLAYFIIGGAMLSFSIKLYLNKIEKSSRYRIELETEVHNRTEELQELNKQLLSASVTDQLTGLHNRRHLDEIIDKEVADIDRDFFIENPSDTERSRLFFLMLDLDGFKPINDTYGHSAGDHVIRDVSELLQRTCRHSDTVIRWGGDEFLVMGRVKDIAEVNQLAERLRKNIQAKVFDIGLQQKLQLSCSIGFSFYPFSKAFPKLLSWEQVQIVADKALYRSKELGRNAWVGILESDKRPPVSFMPMLTQSLQNVIELDLINLIEHSGNKPSNKKLQINK
jgi:diguanylate cyclase (GGDEF)-like protein